MLLLSFAVSWLAGFLFLAVLWPWKMRTPSELLLPVFLAMAFGPGLTSCHLFLWLLVFGETTGFVTSEIVGISILAAVLLIRQSRCAERKPMPLFERTESLGDNRLIALAFGLALALACIILWRESLHEPHGSYDAVSMWNTKALLIFRTQGDWIAAASKYLPHPDYPLLLPLTIARGWSYAGNDSIMVPILVATMFTLASTGLLVIVVALLRGTTQGLLAGLVSLGMFSFLTWGAAQYADIPFAFFVLTTLVLLCLYEYAPNHSGVLLLLAGIAAGLAAWTKNEGLLLMLGVPAVRAAVGLRNQRSILRETFLFFAGVLPVLMVVLLFKSHVASSNDVFTEQTAMGVVGKLLDLSRYALIAAAAAKQLIDFGGWRPNPILVLGLYALVMGFRKSSARDKRSALTAGGALGVQLLGYLLIYLITPRDLDWHLSTSLDRLLLHLWPGLVFVSFIILRSPSDALAQQNRARQQNVS